MDAMGIYLWEDGEVLLRANNRSGHGGLLADGTGWRIYHSIVTCQESEGSVEAGQQAAKQRETRAETYPSGRKMMLIIVRYF
jgi:hypothetical protein